MVSNPTPDNSRTVLYMGACRCGRSIEKEVPYGVWLNSIPTDGGMWMRCGEPDCRKVTWLDKKTAGSQLGGDS